MMPFTDLKEQYLSLKTEIDQAMQKVIDAGSFILGPEVKQLEQEIAAYQKVKYGVGVASGTDALVLALRAAGINPGDEVITTPFTFVATTEAVIRVGAVPVFVDINEKTYNIEPGLIEAKITKKTRAILPVHMYGQCCDMQLLMGIAKKHKLIVIEDCAQAIGAEYHGTKAGSMGVVGCFSFFPAKTLGCYGATQVEILRNHGSKRKNFLETHGYNSRLDTLQAAILLVKLKHLDIWIERRRNNAALYSSLLDRLPGIITPFVAEYGKHSFNYYNLRITSGAGSRDRLEKYLLEKGISCGVYYPLSLHLQSTYAHLGYHKGSLPVSEKIQEEVIALPLYPEMKKDQIELVVQVIKDFQGQ